MKCLNLKAIAGVHPAGLRPWLLAGAAALALSVLAPGLGGAPAFAQGAAGSAADDAQVASGARQSLTRARQAQERGDLRTAQIEYRNAVRADPSSGMLRLALAQVSMDLGDTDTAEKEARTALERGFDPARSTQLLLRAYLARGRYSQVLNEFPLPTDGSTPTVLIGQIGAARVTASLGSNDRARARTELEQALRIAPNVPEVHLAAGALASVEGDAAGLGAAIDRALAINPDHPDALLRKAALLLQRGEGAPAIAALDRVITLLPQNAAARTVRAEAHLRDNNAAKAREDVDAALRVSPNNVPALYLRALIQARGQEWRAADETLARLGPALANLPEGLLVQATVKRGLRQTEQAMDAVQRYVSRRPEDPRGVRLLASMELENRQPAAAVGTLERFVQRGTAEADILDLYARALVAAGRARDAVAPASKAAELSPNDAGLHARLAAARLASGDTAGTAEAAQQALRLSPDQAGARELLIVASLARGDAQKAETELGQLSAEARRGELASIAEATLRVAKLDIAGGRAGFEDVLRRFPESTGARLGLARINSRAGAIDEAQRLWTEVLRRDPGNNEALSALAGLSLQGGPRGTAARSALEAAVKAAPTSPAAAATLASVFTRTGEPQKALTVLEGEALRSGPLARGAAVHLLRADALAALNRWPDVEAAARTAFADEPDSPVTRRQLAFAMARNGDARGAEELVRAGLRQRPGEALLQQTLVSLVQQSRGLDAALGVADELSRQRDAMPAAAPLRGDLLLSAQRPADAARAYAGAYAAAPSAVLAQRTALAWQAAGDLAQASAALESWLQRSPNDTQVLGLLSQFDLQAGRTQAAEARLSRVVEEAPTDAVALNNLAWVLAQRGGPEALARARSMAERAYFLLPTAEAADTLGWVMVRAGEAEKALPLLREAVAARRAAIPPGGTMAPQDPGMSYRLAVALNEMGDRAEALRVLEPVVAENPTFPERAEAERLLSTLRAGR